MQKVDMIKIADATIPGTSGGPLMYKPKGSNDIILGGMAVSTANDGTYSHHAKYKYVKDRFNLKTYF